MIKTPLQTQHIRGKFISHNIKLELHEIETINFFLDRGHLFYKAIQQSPNIIFDLRHLKLQNASMFLIKLFQSSRRAKNLLIITHDAKLLELHKK